MLGAMSRVYVQPHVLRWAIERSNLEANVLRRAFPKLDAWERGEAAPTLRQLQAFADRTHTPLGYLFLPDPPIEHLPIPDFRRLYGTLRQPSADLLDMVYAMQRRQNWLRDHLQDVGVDKYSFVGSAPITDDPTAVAKEMRRVVGLDRGWATETRTWSDALGVLRRHIERVGILAIINGVVGNNTSRKLDVKEFRGFALVDDLAPLIFVNGADATSAQMFTLAHELAHIWLSSVGSGLRGYDGGVVFTGHVERFCDAAAAEFLVPATEMKKYWDIHRSFEDHYDRLARVFKVSPMVVGRRCLDLGLVDRAAFLAFTSDYSQRERDAPRTSGGDFYASQHARVGESFARAIMYAALEGSISFREAYHLTDLHGGTFENYGRRLGVKLP